MTMGPLVAVEFGGMGNAFYGYDERNVRPFDMSEPVLTTKNARNSLKHSHRMLWMQHQDGIKGWNKWEEMFEATLKKEFDIKPNVVPQRVPARVAAPQPHAPVPPAHSAAPPRAAAPTQPVPRTPPAATPAPATNGFSMASLASLARARNLTVEDLSDRNGNLWVRTGDNDLHVNKVLLAWKFTYRHGKGWWR